MRSSRLVFPLCLLLSVALHAALILKLKQYAAGYAPWQPKKKTVETTVPTLTIVPTPKPDDPWGEHAGKGQNINSSPGDTPQTAKESTNDQAAMTRDPSGHGPVSPPTPQAPPAPQAPQASPQPLQQAVNTSPPAALPTPPKSPLLAFKSPTDPAPEAQKPSDSKQQPQQAAPPALASSPPTPPSPPPKPAGGTPLPRSDRDSDPFAKETSVEFKPGQVTARNGRVIKFANPRESLAGYVDSATISFPAKLVLEVDVDEKGEVRDVEILHSTGSRSIDQTLRLAAYSSWFEPMKDAGGKPVRGRSEFTITIR